ncbi:MAG: EamA family transporter [Mangrovimonas sp.]|nr:EamA family transporter [Mangrovimonas sp.]HPF97811.1 EamA family transporter [Mangrovimonas sp.]
MENQKKSLLIILAFFAIYVIWGSTYLWVKIAVAELSPLFLAAFRFLCAGALIFVIAKVMGISLKISAGQLKNTFFAGLCFLVIGNGLMVWALKYIDSGFAALQISAQPLVVLLMMRLLQGKKIKAMSMIGVVLGMIGIFLLVSQKQIVTKDGSLTGILMILICMLSWSYGSLFVSKVDLPKNFFVSTGYQMLSAGVMLLLVSFLLGEQWSIPTQWMGKTQVSMALLIALGSIVAFTSFNYLLKVVSPEKVATSTYVNPIVAFILGWYFLDEQISGQSILAAIILLTGVFFINTKKSVVIFTRFRGK